MTMLNIDWYEFVANPKLPEEYRENLPNIYQRVVEEYDKSNIEMLKKSFGYLYPAIVNHAKGEKLETEPEELYKRMAIDHMSQEEKAELAAGIYQDFMDEMQTEAGVIDELKEVTDDEGNVLWRANFGGEYG